MFIQFTKLSLLDIESLNLIVLILGWNEYDYLACSSFVLGEDLKPGNKQQFEEKSRPSHSAGLYS